MNTLLAVCHEVFKKLTADLRSSKIEDSMGI